MGQNNIKPTGNGSSIEKPLAATSTPQPNRGGGKWRPNGRGVANPVQPGETPAQVVNQPLSRNPGNPNG